MDTSSVPSAFGTATGPVGATAPTEMIPRPVAWIRLTRRCLGRKPVQPALHGRSGLIHRFLLHVLRNSDQGDHQKRLGPFTENGRTDRGEGGEHLEVHRTVDDARPCLAGHLEATDDHRSGREDLNRNRLEQSRFSPSEDGEHKQHRYGACGPSTRRHWSGRSRALDMGASW